MAINNKYNLTGNSYYFFPGSLERTHETNSDIVIPGNKMVLFSGALPDTDVAYEFKSLDELKAAYASNVIFEWEFDLSYKYYKDENVTPNGFGGEISEIRQFCRRLFISQTVYQEQSKSWSKGMRQDFQPYLSVFFYFFCQFFSPDESDYNL